MKKATITLIVLFVATLLVPLVRADFYVIPVKKGEEGTLPLTCSADQIAKYNGTAWVCADLVETLCDQICLDGPTPDFCSRYRYQDNGNGTVTDCMTGLMWEKKTNDNTIHDKDNVYSWSWGGTAFDGTAKTAFLDILNTVPCFAGHCDWRLPSVNRDGGTEELETLLLDTCPGGGDPCIDETVFGPTMASWYWSSVSSSALPERAWYVDFLNGNVVYFYKTSDYHVRGVRGGW